MKHPTRHLTAILVCSAAFALFLTTSCGDQTVSPSRSSHPEFAQADGITPAAQSLPSRDASLETPEDPTYKPEQVSVPLLPGVGGLVTIGRYSVLVPPGALASTTVITIIVREEEGYVSCELLPHGTTFAKPVTLRMDIRETDLAATTSVTIYWLNDATATWVDVGGTLDPSGLTVSTNLNHFSRFAAGRAGW
jgi:hypothetical protein